MGPENRIEPAATTTPPPAAPRGDEANLATDAHADLERAVLPTEVSKPLARTLIIAFCLFLAVVPIVQIVLEATGRQRSQLGELFYREPTRANLHRYEEDVARNSVFKQTVQPEVQLALSRLNGSGNSKVFLGRDGVLFYRPGMNFVTGRGILDPARIRAKRKRLIDAGEASAEADPRPAILAFDAACRSAGAHLVVVPVPDKVMMLPDKVYPTWSAQPSGPLTNVDYARFLQELRSAGVDVYDPTPRDVSSGESLRYLKQDTHWTPEWMDAVARALSDHVLTAVPLPGNRAVQYHAEPVAVRRVGDLVDMLDLPANQTLFPPQEVTIQRTIRTDTRQPWTSDPSADVLFLGDSFANIYTAPPMGWGDSAGLAPALSRHLRRTIDAIAINGAGASGTRRELARRAEGVTGKRLVIWEFAVRELTDASWDVIPMGSAPSSEPTKSAVPTAKHSLEIEATIVAVSKVPQPYSVPYPDCLSYMMFRVDRVVMGQYTDSQILAAMWAMKRNVWLPPAKYAPGRKLRVKLIPMRQAEENVRSAQRADDIEDYKHPPYFVIEDQDL
jgi:hypothetical protein